MDESLFCRLLEGSGRVQVNIVMLAQYYVPFVSFLADNVAPPALHGAIVRGKNDLLAAQTVTDLLGLLRDIAGESTRLEIPPSAPKWYCRKFYRYSPSAGVALALVNVAEPGVPANEAFYQWSDHEKSCKTTE